MKIPEKKKDHLCDSMLESHENSNDVTNHDELIAEFDRLRTDPISKQIPETNLERLNQIAEKLVEINRRKYDKICRKYAEVRGEKSSKEDEDIWRILLEIARKRNNLPQTKKGNTKLKVLDVGTAYGRDIEYASETLKLNIIGIDNSDGFVEILRDLEMKKKIPPGSFRKADMRDLSDFPDCSFDIARYNASLIHLPVIGKGYMADRALSEGHRVLKDRGVIYISVKEGNGLRFDDTNEGLGRIMYQFHTKESIKTLLERNHFGIIFLQSRASNRRHVSWIYVIAEKAL